ncbi:MAG: hypothetical protein V7603_6395 [Micromonosporaceae bacterium]
MNITPVPGVSPPASSSYGAQSGTGRRPSTQEVADALALDPAELDRQVRAGASIADLAAAKGVTTAKVIEAISTLMAPNADLNGDVPARVSLHRTEPVRHRPVHHHEAAAAGHEPAAAPHEPTHPAAASPHDHRPGPAAPLAPPPLVPPPGLPPPGLAPGLPAHAPTPPANPATLWVGPAEEDPVGTGGGSLNTYA